MMFRPDIWTRSVKLAVAITFVFAVLLFLHPPQREDGRRIQSWFSDSPHTWPNHGNHAQNEETATWRNPLPAACPVVPGGANGSDIVITVKTGASEAASRVPIQLQTSLRCPPNILHFSDMAQQVENVTIHDSLAPIAEFVKIGNSDFDLYREQKARQRLGFKQEPVTEKIKEQAWTLDKYKNLHVVHMSYNMIPKKKWYLHLDADTYLVWSSLLWWLPKLDDSKPVYTGSLTCFGDVKAAHGGSGILLSNTATRAIVVDNTSTVPSWDAEAKQHCCGDELVARALRENGVEMHNSWPIINGDKPWTIPFGPQYWCEPIVTMHHLSTKDMGLVAAFEANRKTPLEPVTYHELFKELVYDRIPNMPVENWDNQAEGIAMPDCASFEKCAAECEQNEGCFQAVYDGKDCTLGTRHFRLGEEREPEGEKKWMSVWIKKRMQAFANKHKDCSNWKMEFRDAFVCR